MLKLKNYKLKYSKLSLQKSSKRSFASTSQKHVFFQWKCFLQSPKIYEGLWKKVRQFFCMVKYHEDRLSWVQFSSHSGGEGSEPRVRRLAGAFRRRCGDEGISNVAHQMAMGRLRQKRARSGQALTSSNKAQARLPPVARARAMRERAEPLRRPKLPRQSGSYLKESRYGQPENLILIRIIISREYSRISLEWCLIKEVVNAVKSSKW